MDRLHWLAAALGTWSGPASVAVFAPADEYHAAAAAVGYLRRCNRAVGEQVRR